MKKALIFGLTAALLLALVLVACNKPQADQPAEPDPTPSAVQTQPVETPEPEETPKPAETEKPSQVEQMSVNTQQEADTRREATLMDLLELFQTVYDCRNDWISPGESEEVLKLLELEEVTFQVEANPDVIYPADMQNRYLEWKAINYGTTEPVSAEQQQTTSTAGNTTTTTTQTGTTASTGDDGTAQLTSGDLAVDVTSGKSPMDFYMNGWDEEAQESIDEHGYLDWSKVGFGN